VVAGSSVDRLGLVAEREAVTIRRQLATARPQVFSARLAYELRRWTRHAVGRKVPCNQYGNTIRPHPGFLEPQYPGLALSRQGW
jgi:hypothetical protein